MGRARARGSSRHSTRPSSTACSPTHVAPTSCPLAERRRAAGGGRRVDDCRPAVGPCGARAAGCGWRLVAADARLCGGVPQWHGPRLRARRPPLEMGALTSTLHRTLVTAPHVTPPRPTRKLAVVTNTSCRRRGPRRSPRARGTARGASAQRKPRSWSATTSTDARRTRKTAPLHAPQPPLAPCSVRACSTSRHARRRRRCSGTASASISRSRRAPCSRSSTMPAPRWSTPSCELTMMGGRRRGCALAAVRARPTRARARARTPATARWRRVFGSKALAHELVEDYRWCRLVRGPGGPRFEVDALSAWTESATPT